MFFFLFYFSSAWVTEDNVHAYAENRQKFMQHTRIPKGFKEAVDAMEEALKSAPEDVCSSIAFEIFSNVDRQLYVEML